MKNTSFKFASETIHPGEALNLALPLPQVFSCAPLYMPIKLIHGKFKGPTLLLTAAMYGNEVNGTEIIQRLLSLPGLSKLKGTLIAIPIMNVHGLINRSRYLPNGLDLNRHFPGHMHGTNPERLANIFVTEIFSLAEYCINLQTAPLNHYNLPMVQFYGDNLQALQLAETFNAPIISRKTAESGSLQEVALQQNKIFLDYIAGEAMRFNPETIKLGLNGILNIMRKLEMLPEKTSRSESKTTSFCPERIAWVSANVSGTHHTKLKVGQRINKDDVLSVIKDPFGSNENTDQISPYSGIIIAKNYTPLVHEGDGLFQMAVLPEENNIPEHLENWQENTATQINAGEKTE